MVCEEPKSRAKDTPGFKSQLFQHVPRPGAGHLTSLEPVSPHLQNNAYLAGLLPRLKTLFVRLLAWYTAHGRSSINVSLKKKKRFDWACRNGKDIPSGKAERRVRG